MDAMGVVVADALNIISRNGGAFASRWAHVVVGITWIGLLYYFNFVQVPSFAAMDAAVRNEAIDKLASRALWWFRWAAVATVATGILILLFQPGPGAAIQLFDTDYLKTSPGMSIATGVVLALIMFVNVWGIIWRNQKTVIANARNVQAGGEADPGAAGAGRKAGLASRQNTIFSFTMLMFMVGTTHFFAGNGFDAAPEQRRPGRLLDHRPRDRGALGAQRARRDRRHRPERDELDVREPQERAHRRRRARGRLLRALLPRAEDLTRRVWRRLSRVRGGPGWPAPCAGWCGAGDTR